MSGDVIEAPAPFVTEAPGIHTTIIRGIHHMAIEGEAVRIFTIDKISHPSGVEHRVNGDFLFSRDDLLRMLGEVSEFLYRTATASVAAHVREKLSAMRGWVH